MKNKIGKPFNQIIKSNISYNLLLWQLSESLGGIDTKLTSHFDFNKKKDSKINKPTNIDWALKQ